MDFLFMVWRRTNLFVLVDVMLSIFPHGVSFSMFVSGVFS